MASINLTNCTEGVIARTALRFCCVHNLRAKLSDTVSRNFPIWMYRRIQFTPQPGITADVSDAVAAVMVAGGGIGMSPTYLSSVFVKRGLLVQVMREHSYDGMEPDPFARRALAGIAHSIIKAIFRKDGRSCRVTSSNR